MKKLLGKLSMLFTMTGIIACIFAMLHKPVAQAAVTPPGVQSAVTASGLTLQEMSHIHASVQTMKNSKRSAQLAAFVSNSSTGSVNAWLVTDSSGVFTAYLYVTGASRWAMKIDNVRPPGYGNKNVQFNGVPTGHKYFIRMVEQDCTYGGQTGDNNFTGGNMGLGNCYCTNSWSSGCPPPQ